MLGRTMDAHSFLEWVARELGRVDPDQVHKLADLVWDCYEAGRFVFVIGNGGSGSNSSHFCEDMGKCSLDPLDFDDDSRKRLKILSLTDNTPYILAWANDEGFDRVFSEQLKNLASPGDLLVAISGSGNSKNIIRAVEWANRNGLTTFGCTGFDGGRLREMAHFGLHVPSDDMGIVESIHLTAFHWVVDETYRRVNQEPALVPAGKELSPV